MAWMNFQNNYFRKHLLYEALLSQNNSKCMLSSLSNRAIFFLEYFILKNHRKKTRTFILTSMMRGNYIIAFHHDFMLTFYDVTLQKLFFTDEPLKILIFLKQHTFNFKHYLHKTCFHRRFILFYIQITKSKKNISRRLLKNLIL